jgi:hypothetical protein
MKNIYFFAAGLCFLLFSNCEKDPVKTVFGRYAGQLKASETGVKEVFTSPTESYFEPYAMVTTTLDTLEITETGDEKFIIDPFPFLEFAFSTQTAVDDTVHYMLNINGGYFDEKCAIHFDTTQNTLFFEGYSAENGGTVWKKTEYIFNGVKL